MITQQILEMDPNKIYTVIVEVGDMDKISTMDFLQRVKYLYEQQGITNAVYAASSHGISNIILQETNPTILPVNVSDKLYIINKGNIYPVFVRAIRLDAKSTRNRIHVAGTFHYSDSYVHNYKATFPFESLGKTLFRSEEEAKANLQLNLR